jgi:hypothetical protein
MSRFFAFGCSFTASHDRPTWADIIGREFDFYENYARGGSGNQYIFNQLIECNTRRKFTPDDTVIIMWTSITREDRYVKNLQGWHGQGNIFWSQEYPQEWIKKFACERGYLIRDLATITAARDLLKHWGVKYKFLAMMPIGTGEHKEKASGDQDVFDLYKDTLAEIKPSVFEVIFNSENWNKKHSDFLYVENGIRDPHPDPKESLEYVQKVIPEIALSQSTIDYVNTFKLGDQAPQFYLVERL